METWTGSCKMAKNVVKSTINKLLATLSREVIWSHNLIIISAAKTDEAREFYLTLAVKNKYSVRELERQVDAILLFASRYGQQGMKAPTRTHNRPFAQNSAFILCCYAQGRNRTIDTGIFSPLLCQLSYLGV